MKLVELFNSEANIRIKHDADDSFEAWAKIGESDICFQADYIDETDGDDGWYVRFTKDGQSFDLTNDGHAAKVLSFVKRCLEMLVDSNEPDKMTFTASGGRQDVYRKMIKRFMPDNYEVEETKTKDTDTSHFVLVKKS